jgi:hypothetical protein
MNILHGWNAETGRLLELFHVRRGTTSAYTYVLRPRFTTTLRMYTIGAILHNVSRKDVA